MGADHRVFLEATLPHLDAVWQVARQAAGEGQDPEDLVQETYLRAYAGFGSFRGGNTRPLWTARGQSGICRRSAYIRRIGLPG